MDRRRFLSIKGIAKQIAYPEFRTFSGMAFYAPPIGASETMHLLKRTLFGVKKKRYRFAQR